MQALNPHAGRIIPEPARRHRRAAVRLPPNPPAGGGAGSSRPLDAAGVGRRATRRVGVGHLGSGANGYGAWADGHGASALSRAPASGIRVLLVDDHAIVREGLRMLLAGAPDMTVVGDTGNGSDALALAARAAPDVVLLDLDLAGEDGLPLVPQLQRTAGAPKALILTASRDRARHEAALLAGARGVVVKDRSADLLLKAIRRVHAGELWFDRALLDAVVQRSLRSDPQVAPEAARIAKLTGREREIVTLIGEGLRNEEIGRRLFISEKTVRNHLSTIFEKVAVSDRLELVVYAFNNGLASARR